MSGIVRPPGRLDRGAEAAGRLGSLLFVAIVAITAWEVVLRYVFGAPTTWVHEVSVTLAAAAFVIGGPAVHAGRAHIAITAFLERVSPRWQVRLRVLHSLLTLAFLVLLAYAAIDQAWVSVRDMETSGTALNLPTPVFLKSLFAVACVLLCAQTLGHLLADIEAWRGDGGAA
ncbi:MAG: TRAP transporter small permease [Betaproteobacteria bacterium]|jgi:TRAP-type C4-dicarboxylate transport system permease small subunit